jgi:hypothetical protein
MRPARPGGFTLALIISACSDPVSPTPACTLEQTTSATVTLQLFQGTRVSDRCIKLAGGGTHYLVVPQFAVQGDKPAQTAFHLRGLNTTTTAALSVSTLPVFSLASSPAEAPQRRLDRTLRSLERELAPTIAQESRGGAYRGPRAQLSMESGAGALASTRAFQVLGDLSGKTFKTANADLKYTGTNIAIYVDKLAPANGFTDQTLQDLGKLFDQTLFPIDVNAFGAPSDIDANGVVIVLITPLINALTNKADCTTTGYVTGYFYGLDLSLTAATTKSNRGEVFYAIAPDPNGTVSCGHTVSQVTRTVPGTFIHELQHMISYGQHVITRGGQDEVAWLNEGLSHIAEELGSKYYEAKYPAPAGRTSPNAIFPDSSLTFIAGDLSDAWRYLHDPTGHSVTTFDSFGSLEERGAAWLFLRWLGDQKGDAIFKSLVQTNVTGVANIESKAGETFPALFGDFGIAIWTDSMPGLPRNTVPDRYRFKTRNLRQLFGFLSSTGSVSSPWPIAALKPIPLSSFIAGSMVQGTMDFFDITAPANVPTLGLQFSKSNNAPFPSGLNAQVALFRLP